MYPRFGRRMRQWLEPRARAHPAADPVALIPEWFLQHWHFAPGGYLTGVGRAWYEHVISRFYYQSREGEAHRRVIGQLRGAGARRVLDIGCGPGHLTSAVARAGFTTSAVDLAPGWVAQTRARTPRADVRHADATSLPWTAGSFDAVILAHVAGHVPRRVATAILAEAARMPAPGGHVILVEHAWHDIELVGRTVVSRTRFAAGMQEVIVIRCDND